MFSLLFPRDRVNLTFVQRGISNPLRIRNRACRSGICAGGLAEADGRNKCQSAVKSGIEGLRGAAFGMEGENFCGVEREHLSAIAGGKVQPTVMLAIREMEKTRREGGEGQYRANNRTGSTPARPRSH